MQVEQELLDLHTGRPLTECDLPICCINTIDLLIDEHVFARNMYRIEINVLHKRIVRQVGHLPVVKPKLVSTPL